MDIKKFSIVLVEWDDAWSSQQRVNWDDAEKYEQPCPSITVGILKSQTDKEVVVCRDLTPGEFYEDGQATVAACQRIPMAIVKNIRVLGQVCSKEGKK